jgi:signal transduction histidine kinase
VETNIARLPLAPTAALSDSEILTATVEQLSTADTIDRVTDVVTGAIRSLLGADGATFILREDGLCFYADENAVSPLWKGSRFPMSSCISGWAMLHDEVVVIRDIYDDPRIPHDAYRSTFVRSLAMAPVRTARPIAALGAYWRDEHEPSSSEVRLLEILANSAAVSLENLDLRETVRNRAAERDHLAARADELESAIHTIAHDLRSPLGAMLGYAELIEEAVGAEDPSPTRQRTQQFARTIQDSGLRMAEQIDRMLALYGVTRRQLQPERVDLTRMCLDIVQSLGARAQDRDLDVTIEEGLVAHCDPVLIHLMLENLLGNAVKYTAREPVARIALRRAADEHIGTPHPMTTFVLQDNGVGFRADQAHLLFRPMRRLHPDAEFPGTGLGLASVARIVERHGGHIRAEGIPSVGASFYFTLPCTPESALT